MIKDKKNKNRGAVSVIFAVLLLSMLLTIGLGVSVLMFQQLRMSSQSGDSATAFYAADAGAERCLYQVWKSIGEGCDSAGSGNAFHESLSSGAAYDVFYEPGFLRITSTGQFRTTSRALQLNW